MTLCIMAVYPSDATNAQVHDLRIFYPQKQSFAQLCVYGGRLQGCFKPTPTQLLIAFIVYSTWLQQFSVLFMHTYILYENDISSPG